MSESAQGTVTWAGSNTIKTKAGKNAVMHSFKIDNSDEYFRCGFVDPKVEKGEYIKFDYEVHPSWGNQVEVKSVTKVEEKIVTGGSTPPATKKSGPAKENYEARAQYWEDKEKRDIETQIRISYQAATNTAIEVVRLALEQDAISLGAAKAKKLDLLKSYVEEVAEELFSKYQMKPHSAVQRGLTIEEESEEELTQEESISDD